MKALYKFSGKITLAKSCLVGTWYKTCPLFRVKLSTLEEVRRSQIGTNSCQRNLWATPAWKYLKSWKKLTNLLVKVHATFISYLNFFLKIQTKYGMANCQFANTKCSMSVRKKRSTDSKKYLLGKPLESSKKVSKAELHCFRWWFLLKWRFSCCPSTLLSSHYSQNPKVLSKY